MKKVRRHYVFSGSVQGVGFRYRARHAADCLGLTGWVRNRFDGTVEMEVQGEPETIHRMLEMIQRGTWVDIMDMQVRELPLDTEERAFHVR